MMVIPNIIRIPIEHIYKYVITHGVIREQREYGNILSHICMLLVMYVEAKKNVVNS